MQRNGWERSKGKHKVQNSKKRGGIYGSSKSVFVKEIWSWGCFRLAMQTNTHTHVFFISHTNGAR